MKHSQEKFSVVIPVYNEADRIQANIRIIKKVLDDFKCSYEIVVIDDGSQDNTYELLKELKKNIPNLVINKNATNYGKGRALKKAFRYTTGDLIIWLDADLDLHPFQISTLYDIMMLDKADIVIGSKTHPNSVVNYPLSRRIISMGYYCFVYMFFGLPCHDTQTGLKLFKREVLKKVLPRILVKQFAFDLEVLVNAHHLGFSISEAPIVLKSQRRFGRIGIDAITAAFLDTMAIWYRMYILKYYDNIDNYRRKGMLREFKRVRK